MIKALILFLLISLGLYFYFNEDEEKMAVKEIIPVNLADKYNFQTKKINGKKISVSIAEDDASFNGDVTTLGNLKYINQEAQSLIGYSEKQIKKMEFKNVFGQKIFDEIILCIKNQSPKILRDIFLEDKFSNEINVHIFINPTVFVSDKKTEFEFVLIQLFNLEGRNVLYKQNKLIKT